MCLLILVQIQLRTVPKGCIEDGMPTYSFSVQTSHLTSMAEEGFDFNAYIYNGKLVFNFTPQFLILWNMILPKLIFLLKLEKLH